MEILTADTFKKTPTPRSRKRRSYSCHNCRVKRIRCDRKKPCSACKEKKIKECVYETNDEKIEEVEAKNKADVNEWNSLPLDHVVNYFETVISKKKRVLYFGLTSPRSIYDNLLMGLRDIVSAHRRLWKEQNLGFKKVLQLDHSLDLDDISQCFPPYDTSLSLLNSFFGSIWFKRFPIVEKKVVLDQFKFLFYDDNGTLEVHKNENSNDMMVVIMLLIECAIQEQELNDGLLLDKGTELFNTATNLLFKGEILRFSTLPTLQSLLLLRIHKKFNLRDNDGGDGSNGTLLHSLTFHMAITMGLHRNIDVLFADASASKKTVLKNIWVCLLYLDASNLLDIGVPLQISDGYFDKKIYTESPISVECIETMRYCASESAKLNVTVYNIVECIKKIKHFLAGKEARSVIEQFFKEFFNTTTVNECQTTAIKFFDILPLFSLLSHYYMVLGKASSNLDNEQGKEMYLNSALKYAVFILLSCGGFFMTLRDSFQSSFLPIWSQLFLYATGALTKCVIMSKYFSMTTMSNYKERQTELVQMNLSEFLSYSLPEQLVNEKYDFRINNPAFLSFCINFYLKNRNNARKKTRSYSEDYFTSVINFLFELFMNSFYGDSDVLNELNSRIKITFGNHFELQSDDSTSEFEYDAHSKEKFPCSMNLFEFFDDELFLKQLSENLLSNL